MPRALAAALAALFALLHAAGAGAAGPPSVIRVGGPSAPDESKVAVIGSNHDLRGHRFSVSDTATATWSCATMPSGCPACRPAPSSAGRPRGRRSAPRALRPRSPFDSRFATYEDRRVDYVTSEPAIDYTASSVLLIAALEGRC